MTNREQEGSPPLTVETLSAVVAEGLKGTERFWQQFDLFQIMLRASEHKKFDISQNPFIAMRAEFHLPPNTVRPQMHDTDAGNVMNESIKTGLNGAWPGLFERWESGFQGGNARGWDINFYGILDAQADRLQIPLDDGQVTLFRYERPQEEREGRQLEKVVPFEFIQDGGPIFIGPDGITTIKELRKIRKAPEN